MIVELFENEKLTKFGRFHIFSVITFLQCTSDVLKLKIITVTVLPIGLFVVYISEIASLSA